MIFFHKVMLCQVDENADKFSSDALSLLSLVATFSFMLSDDHQIPV